MPMPRQRSMKINKQRHRQHRRGQHHDQAGGINGPQKQRQPRPRQPRRPHAVNRDDEVQAGQNRREAGDEHSGGGGHDVRVGVDGAERGVKRPARVDAPPNDRIQREQSAGNVDVPTGQVQPRKGDVAGPDHQRHEKIAQHAGNRGHEKEENHHDAMHREQLVVGLGLHQIGVRRGQVDADQRGRDAADDEKEGNAQQVQQADPLVVGRQQPRTNRGAVVQIVVARKLGGLRHGWALSGFCAVSDLR